MNVSVEVRKCACVGTRVQVWQERELRCEIVSVRGDSMSVIVWVWLQLWEWECGIVRVWAWVWVWDFIEQNLDDKF